MPIFYPRPRSGQEPSSAPARRRPPASIALVVLALAAACDAGSENAFIAQRGLDPCIQVLPACPGMRAECVLDDARYTRRTFPGDFRFLVRADALSRIEVLLFLSEQRDAGVDTRIDWNEPGCADVYTYESGGRNLFEEAEKDSTIRKSKTVYEGGEHLIEVISDMQAKVVIAVEVTEPESE